MNPCPHCGVEPDDSNAGGLSPACLMAAGLESQVITPSGSEVRRPDATGDSVEDGRFGPYRIVGLIGEGGMGKVYRAHDPRMGRDVAIKVSAVRFTGRFEREVHAVAALNHPNICQVYDVGPNYLLMGVGRRTNISRPYPAICAAAGGGTGDCAPDRGCSRDGAREGRHSS